ncbi:MAG: hypothetical protein ABI123_07635 [Ginsengibacter sp.]|jgi:hypothetical protein
MRTSDYENEYEPKVRPSFLTILCILTFIGSGMSIISSVFAYKTADKSNSIFSQIAKGNTDTVNASTVTIKDSTYVNDSLIVSNSAIEHQNKVPKSELEVKMQRSAAKMFTKENIQKKSIGDFLAAIFTLTGAILMWNLRRQGFYVYIIGVLISFFVPLYLYGTDLMSIGLSIISAFFGLVFIALYALNLKAMRRQDEESVDFG